MDSDCLDSDVYVVRNAKQDARVPEPDTIDASPLFGKHRGLIIKMSMQCRVLMIEISEL